jgi:hypothetical protein
MVRDGCVRSRTDVGESRIGRSQGSLVMCGLVAADEIEMGGAAIQGLAVVGCPFKAQGGRPGVNDVVVGTSVPFGCGAANMSNRCGPSSTERKPFLGLGETFVASHYVEILIFESILVRRSGHVVLFSPRGPQNADNVRPGNRNRCEYRTNCLIEREGDYCFKSRICPAFCCRAWSTVKFASAKLLASGSPYIGNTFFLS